MHIPGMDGPESPIVVLGAVTTLMAIPTSFVVMVAGFLGIGRSRVDSHVAQTLDRFLAEEANLLRQHVGPRLLDFPTSYSVPATTAGLGWGKVQVYRTILTALKDGYRIRVRAYAEGARGRVIVRCRDVDLRRKR